MPVLALLVFLLSGALAFFGVMQLTQATVGVGLIALACYCGIVARLAQATGHFENQRAWFHVWRKATIPPPAPTAPPEPLIYETQEDRTRKQKQTTRLVFIALGVLIVLSTVLTYLKK